MTAATITANIQIGLDALASVIDLGDASFRVEEDRSIDTAELRGDVILVNPDFYASTMSSDRPDAVEYLGMHEGLHHWFRDSNPAWQEHVIQGWDGDHWQFYFGGLETLAVYGPVPVNAHGHIMLPDLIMSHAPHYRDHPQALSAIELAMLTDMGVHVWTQAERLVNATYQAVLHREADAAGRAWWVGELESGRVTDETIVDAIAWGAQGSDAVQLQGVAHAYWGIA